MSNQPFSEHLAGPWTVVLADQFGFVYPTPRDAADAIGRAHVVDVSVVRGTALPQPILGGGQVLRRPIVWEAGDVAYTVRCRLVDPEHPQLGAAARWEQAMVMAAGLNAAGHRVTLAQPVGGVL